MAQREVCFVIGKNDEILWADASNDPAALPDSRARWEAIWKHRNALAEIAHSHPNGPERFSAEDEGTMTALAAALGKAPRFSVVTPRARLVRENGRDEIQELEPWWVHVMRLASGMNGKEA